MPMVAVHPRVGAVAVSLVSCTPAAMLLENRRHMVVLVQ